MPNSTADPPQITTERIRGLAERLVTPELVILPVRHHSPACAAAVAHAFDTLNPSAVLIEGPRDFADVVPLLAAPEAEQPLAVFSFVRQAGRVGAPVTGRGAYYPFCDYSPELVAVQRGVAAGVPVRFIDLEVAEQAAVEKDGAQKTRDEQQWSLLDERVFGFSATLQRLAEGLGCRDHEDLWELLFEADEAPWDGAGFAEHVARLAAYCLLVRHDRTAEELHADGTVTREAEMAWHVRDALKQRAKAGEEGPVLVVVGGMHAVVLPDLLADPPKRPDVRTGRVETGHALIRYDFDRLERLNGYASGMTSPNWHQHVWERRLAGDTSRDARTSAALRMLLDLADELRGRHRALVPTPSLSAAYQHALVLADLRERPGPLRSDLLDSVVGVLVPGDVDTEGVVVRAAAHRVLTGRRVGVVPPQAGTPPLVEDVRRRLRAARLDADAVEPRSVALDLYRNPAHRRTSRLLHGLVALGVPFAAREAGPDFVSGGGLSRLQERWSHLWTPATDGALVEASVHGSTLPAAVSAAFTAELAALTDGGRVPGSAEATGRVARAAVLGLHEQASGVVAVARSSLAADASFPDVVTALGTLGLVTDGREPLEAHRIGGLPALFDFAYARALFLASELRGEEYPPERVVDALRRLRELVVSPAGESLDGDLFWAIVEDLRTGHDLPMVRGAAAGLLHDAGRLDDTALARDVVGHLAGSRSPSTAVGFVRGLLATAREVLWHDVGLVPALDAHLAEWTSDTFVAHLPDLRLAFADLTPRETERVSTIVARLHGLADDAGLGLLRNREASETDLMAGLALSERVRDLMTADHLGGWVR